MVDDGEWVPRNTNNNDSDIDEEDFGDNYDCGDNTSDADNNGRLITKLLVRYEI